ncbi:hypothetical protein MNEG_6580, partial [Monoraphidium neglectum]
MRQRCAAQESPLDVVGSGGAAALVQLQDLQEAAANLLVGPSALRRKVLSEQTTQVDDGAGGRTLLIRREVLAKEVALLVPAWDGCAPLYKQRLLQ